MALVNYKETRLADPTCGGNGVGDHKRHSLPLTPYRVSSVGVSADMVNLTVSIIPLPAEVAR